MTVRFLHTSDWQLGMTRHYLAGEAQPRFTADRVDTVRTLLALALERECSFVVVAGDVFDHANLSPQDMGRALEAGGTSFDSLYVNINGESGYFSRSLNAYGRAGQPCLRCEEEGRDGVIVREQFMNRSSYRCAVCQRRPRRARY